VYDGLPVSSGGAHGLGRTTGRNAFENWHAFLAACASLHTVSYYFDLPHTPELTVEPEIDARIRREFPAVGRRFMVPVERIDEALDLLDDLEPQPTNPWGMAPVWLRGTADFSVRNPDGRLWPGQDPALFGSFETPTGVRLGASRTNLIVQAKRSMGLLLSVPEASDADLERLVPWLQEHLPFRLSPKHWSRWTLAKNRRTYRGRRIAI
jgi:hypothetical protein